MKDTFTAKELMAVALDQIRMMSRKQARKRASRQRKSQMAKSRREYFRLSDDFKRTVR